MPDALPGPDGSRDYLTDCLRYWPSSHALLRAIECRKLARHPLRAPILEVGCGDGVVTRLLFPEGVSQGIDLNRREVYRARANRSHGAVHVASATHLPFREASFQSVFSNCVLEHVSPLDVALREIGRVLVPEGLLLTTVPTPRWESEGPFPVLRRWGCHRISEALNRILRRLWHHVTMEDEEGWRRRLSAAGLTLLAWEPYMGEPSYAAYARYLPFSLFSFVLRRLTGRWLISSSLRSLVVPYLARRLREIYRVDDAVGACALVLARKDRPASTS